MINTSAQEASTCICLMYTKPRFSVSKQSNTPYLQVWLTYRGLVLCVCVWCVEYISNICMYVCVGLTCRGRAG